MDGSTRPGRPPRASFRRRGGEKEETDCLGRMDERTSAPAQMLEAVN
jgi:hypothetical protein